ncbi:MAG: two-component system, OmpR family, phosphate regulon sensor histidine kinase PhoR, partial [Pseudonocardiales bacterium]|nr:two-component system, OmpR family, phosphate regulon sensor histidine kinase PhoR [Pseudonocardiales bacterium]
RRLTLLLLLLLVAVGTAGVLAVQAATGQVSDLAKGYGPAGEEHAAALTLMLDAETGVRGYLITGNRSFLQPYQSGRNRILPTLDSTAANLHAINEHGLDAAISAERTLAEQWLSSYADPIAGQPRPANAVEVYQQQGAKQLFDRFRKADSVVGASLDANRRRLREDSQRLGSLASPILIITTGLAVLIAAILAFRIAAGLSRPLRALRTVVGRLDRGDLGARANEQDGPSEVRALARAVNAVGRRARAEAIVDRDAEVFRQRTRLIASTIRRTTNGTQMAELLVRGLGDAMEADRIWLQVFADERVPRLSAQWQREPLKPLPEAGPEHLEMARTLANRLWESAHIITIDDHRTYQPTTAGRGSFGLAQAIGASASLVVPIGDSVSAFGLLWVSMAGHSRHWTLTETGIAQHLAADLAHSLVQSHVIERQNQAVQLLRELDQAKADFIATVSHELRTPLTSISGYLEMLQDGDAGRLPDSAAAMLSVIDRNATRLRNLIEDLLTQSRIDAGRLRLELTTVQLRPLLHSVLTAMAPLASASDVKLELGPSDDNLSVQADPQQLEQVFTNLISNALKFTPAGGSVLLTLAPADDGVLIEVRDTGMGVPPDDYPNLFTRFFRASNAAEAALPGTGLGLAIVQEIVHRHGGAVDIDSELGVGTTVTVWLPAVPQDASLRP